jgi:hypothetical protein
MIVTRLKKKKKGDSYTTSTTKSAMQRGHLWRRSHRADSPPMGRNDSAVQVRTMPRTTASKKSRETNIKKKKKKKRVGTSAGVNSS